MDDKDVHLYAMLNTKLIESGQRDVMKELLKRRLVECQWRDQMKAYCRDFIKQKGYQDTTVEQLIKEISPKGRALVPDAVRQEMLTHLRKYLSKM